mgnify:CR=1 FL=1
MKKRGIHSRATSKYVFLLPGFLFFTFAVLIPLILGINIAFTDWNGITKDYNYVGFDNFIRMFSDKRILAPVRNTLLFALFGTAGNNIISLGLALLVNQKIGKWSNAAKSCSSYRCASARC